MKQYLTEPRLWDKVRVEGDCWVWTGAKANRGYSEWRPGGRGDNRWRVHRLVYTMMIDDIPEGLTLDHLCMVKLCVNPYHMDPTPIPVNQARWVASRKTCRNGHAFTPENTYVRTSGRRECRLCKQIGERRRKQERRARQA